MFALFINQDFPIDMKNLQFAIFAAFLITVNQLFEIVLFMH